MILINGGTTTAEMVPFLDAARDVTVITNGLHIASLLAPLTNIKTVITGGVLRNSELSMLGALTEDALHNLRRALHEQSGHTWTMGFRPTTCSRSRATAT